MPTPNPIYEEAVAKAVALFQKNLPKGFELTRQYNMDTFVVPLKTYKEGYHCTPDTPLPFVSIAATKNHLSIYHMGIYAMPDLLSWFQKAHAKASPKKLNMGKSCIKYAKVEDIPWDLIKELAQKINVQEWIAVYEKNYKKK
jgi:hypothetical protein